jgi:hypothetical protein
MIHESEIDKTGNEDNQENDQPESFTPSPNPSNVGPIISSGAPLVPVQTWQVQIPDFLSKADINTGLNFLSQYHQRELEQRQRELEQQRIKDQQQYELLIKQQELQERANQDSRNIIRLGIAVFGVVFIVVLIYASFTKDTELPRLLITLVFGAIGGGAVVKSTSTSARNQKPENPDQEIS